MAKKYEYGIPVYERIRAWLMYNGENNRPSAPHLLDGDLEVWGRLQTLRSLLTQKALSYHDALPMQLKQYGISEATFWRDVRGLAAIVGDLEGESRSFEKLKLKEMALKAYQMAERKEDSKGMTAAVRNLITLNGFDRDEPEGVDPDKLNPGVYPIVLDDSVRDLFLKALDSSSVVDLTKMLNNASAKAEEIEYEVIDPGGAGKKGN